MSLPEETKRILEEHNLTANKVLGQNFLINEEAIDSLVDAARLTPETTVLEVGPGLGSITKRLCEKAGRVIAVEKDPAMVAVLGKELAGKNNVEVVQEDILRFNPTDHGLRAGEYVFVGAPPYYLTARLFRTFLESHEAIPASIAFIIQKEVAEKIIATPPRATILSNAVQSYGSASIECTVGRHSFLPQPNVDSALLVARDITKPPHEKALFSVLRAGFSSPRKQLGANIANAFHIERDTADGWLNENGIDPSRRAQTLSVKEWQTLAAKKGDISPSE